MPLVLPSLVEAWLDTRRHPLWYQPKKTVCPDLCEGAACLRDAILYWSCSIICKTPQPLGSHLRTLQVL